ncbi:MAG: diaminopimelate epimerase [Pontiellaceae bacterium]|nr:diaminopimelate epimerase [Pontiellaceae bacterium]MBN2784231.1 diaminopimelate epimerase [Pontiellaceae bacterium]
MKIAFTKMHGAGNDFIVVDDRTLSFPTADVEFIRRISKRATGVGCDGILLVQPSDCADVRMRFINPDGGEQDMCGNGARCFARFAYELGVVPERMRIETGAGIVNAEVLGLFDRAGGTPAVQLGDGAGEPPAIQPASYSVRLELTEPSGLQLGLDAGLEWSVDFLNTGVPHAVAWVDNVAEVDLPEAGRRIRYDAFFAPAGTNANFAQVEGDGSLRVRTYERGVEAETLACGTGATAVALLAARRGRVSLPVAVHCAGGYDLVIDLKQGIPSLTGNAETVYDGEIEYGNRV